MNIFFIMAGGFLGTIFRFLLGEWLQINGSFPFSTLITNFIGCLFLGWFFTRVQYKNSIDPKNILFIATGFIGSFTTFSTFSLEFLGLIESKRVFLAVLYVFLSICLGIGFTYVGYLLGAKRKEKTV